MTDAEIAKAFANFLGPDRFARFLEVLDGSAREKRELMWWQEVAWEKFATSTSLEVPATYVAVLPVLTGRAAETFPPFRRLKEYNQSAPLPLLADDFLWARETSRYVEPVSRVKRTHIAKTGYAEQDIRDTIYGQPPRSAYHHHDHQLSNGDLKELSLLLQAARRGHPKPYHDPDPNDWLMVLSFWQGKRERHLVKRWQDGTLTAEAPAFDIAWAAIVALFPEVPYLE